LDRARAAVQSTAGLRIAPADLRRKWLPPEQRDAGVDLLTFLRTLSDERRDGLEVTVAGHGKGGALAPTVALWLREAHDSSDPGERWDEQRQSQIRCHAFAGPSPGNSAFAARIDARLGEDHHHLRNMNDLVTHAWQVDELLEVPTLYGKRSERLGCLIPG